MSREFEALFTAAPEAVIVVDDARQVVDANPAACHLLGRPCDEVRGRAIDDFLQISADDLDARWETFVRAGDERGDARVVRPDGSTRDVEYSATAQFVPGRHLAFFRDVTERKQAELDRAALRARERQRLRETETLLAVSRTLGATLDPTETMRRVAREIAHAVGADMVGAYLADPARERLRPIAGYNVPRHLLDAFLEFPIPIKGHRVLEQVWRRPRAVWTDDMAAHPDVDPETYARFPHQSDIFVPILVKGAPVGGFFVIWWTERRACSADELRILESISDLAGISLENAQLYRDAAEDNRRKDEFLAALSHELRNPLGAITNAVAALDRPELPVERSARLRQIVQRQIRHLARLLDDLLDVARVTAGKITLRREPCDLGAIAGRCVQLLRDTGAGEAHRIVVDADSVIVDADPARMEQVATNLLDNAVKYTPAGGEVRVDVRAQDGFAVLRVTDTGIGIPPEGLSSIFDVFTQLAAPAGSSRTGLGLGLTLARRLVELHGGTISATSEGHGRGSEFMVRLPLST